MPEADLEILKRGNLKFFFRHTVEEKDPEGIADIQNFYKVMSVHGEDRYRSCIIGGQKLPKPEASGNRRYWGFVDAVLEDPKKIVDELKREEYETETRGERHQPAARPMGEGIYRILRHGDHTHLVYALELPDEPDEVQRALNLEEEASYILTVKNPEKPSPARAGLPERAEANYPERLQERFRDRRFIPADPPDFLVYPGAEIVLISASADPEDVLDVELHPQEESESTAEIFNDLRLEKSQQPVKPLVEGEWD